MVEKISPEGIAQVVASEVDGLSKDKDRSQPGWLW